jgi:Tfp pilus assembly protein PilF
MRYKCGMAKKTLNERLIDAQTRGSAWLADANQLAEAGQTEKAERYYKKAQFWLDRANQLDIEHWMRQRESK